MTGATREGVEIAAAWRLLSLGFTSPTQEILDEVQALAEALSEVEPTPELGGLLDSMNSVALDDFSAQFTSLFRGRVRVAPYEGSYELDPIRQGRQMADVAAFYRAFGAEAHGPGAERPDFVGCELEFLSFLELRRLAALEAGEEGAEIVEGIRDTFLRDHASRWLPTFLGDVLAAAEHAHFYGSLASYGLSVLEGELDRLGIEPSPLPRRPESSLDGDTLECGAAEPSPAL